MTPARAREMVDLLRACFRVSIRRACEAVPANRSTYHYRSREPGQAALRKRVREIAEARVRYGYRRIHVLLRRGGWPVNAERVHRLYRLEGLRMRLEPPRRRVTAELREDRVPAAAPNDCWLMDRMCDELFDGTRLWLLTAVDNHTRLCPAIRACRKATAMEVITALGEAARAYGVPRRVRCDNGARFTAEEVDLRAYANGVVLDFSRPGKPTDNAFAESLNAGSGPSA